MRNTTYRMVVATGVLVVAASGCSKVSALLGKGGADGGASASAGTSTLPGATGGGGPLAFLNGFEGEIDVTAKGKLAENGKSQAPIAVPLLLKDGKIRADVPANLSEQQGHIFGVYDGPGKKITIVMDQQKQAIVIDLNKTGEQLSQFSKPKLPSGHGSSAPSKPPPKVEKTGKNDTVAGYKCEIWRITDTEDGSKAEVCVASEGASWFSIPMTGAPAEFAWMSELMDGKHFPLRFVAFDKAGAETGRVEVSKIDKKTEAANQFEVPAGYKVTTLEDMFRGGAGGVPPSRHAAH